VVVGSGRTAEELGRAFPGFSVRTSGGDRVLAEVPSDPAVVVCTPGAEPLCPDGYGAALLLDGWALLSRADLRAGEETVRRWLAAAALVRPGGVVVVGADAAIPAVQALVRCDPVGYAGRELGERRELGFPPAARLASITGAPGAVAELLASARLPEAAEVIGPVPVVSASSRPSAASAPAERVLVRVPRSAGLELAAALKAAAAVRSARKAADPVKLALDPAQVL
jgi:primosomal protein N' (replication factor Y)